MNKRLVIYTLTAIAFAGCHTKNMTEAERFDASVREELPFAVDSLRWLDGVDMATYQFACKDYVATPPDAFIGLDGSLNVYNNFLFEKPTRQSEDMVWRNVVVSKTQLEEAARRGDLAPAYMAATKDRIDIREGRPQKYGTQLNCPVLDSLRVNEWRQEVGLPPIEVK